MPIPALRVLTLAGLAALSSCNGVKGSCDQRPSGAGECREILASTIKDTGEYQCTKSATSTERGTWSAKGCEHAAAIGACESSLDRTWYFKGGPVTTVGQISTLCFLGKVLDANGKELKDVKAEAVAPGPRNDPGLATLIAAAGPKLESAVAAIERTRLPAGAPGPVHTSSGKPITNGTVVSDTDLAKFTDRTAAYEKDYPLKDADDFHACGVEVRTKDRQGKSDDDVKRILSWCAAIPYLLVVRTSKLTAPTSRTGLDFVPGVAEGQVFVFELPTGKAIGGYAFRAESSNKVKANELESDFRANLAKAMAAGLAKANPGASTLFQVNPPRQ